MGRICPMSILKSVMRLAHYRSSPSISLPTRETGEVAAETAPVRVFAGSHYHLATNQTCF
jgi:hypothetical protein